MEKTLFKITKMDCPSEENLIRIKLGQFSEIKGLEFDIPDRQLTVIHEGNRGKIEDAIISLNLGAKLLKTEEAYGVHIDEQTSQRNLLWAVLFINFAFFLIELTTGYISKSMGLIADSLDMLADSFVYGIGLFAVGGTQARKKNVAKVAGYFQILLAVIGFIEVIRRAIGAEKIPDFHIMIYISILALTANTICLFLLHRSKSKEAHMRASMIFTSNDVIINLGVIIAALFVGWLDSSKPDLIIGGIVFILVIQGAFRILKLGK